MIKFDENNNVQDYTIVLSLRTHKHLGQINNIEKESVVSKINMNSANELSFTVYKYKNGDEDAEIEPLWDSITDFKYVYVKELNEYYEIVVETNDEETIYKSVTGTSACECELSQSQLYNFEINSEADIARDDYINPTVFYDKMNPDCSLLHRALTKLPQYSIGHVDGSLMKIQRTFSEDDVDVYSFLTETVAEEIGCLFTFDSVNRKINAYDLKNVCLDCGYRGEFSGACPKCGSNAIQYYGNDTTVYVDKENLAESITFSTDTESVKNCFKLEAGDDNMTAAVINRNPNGSDYIYYFSEEAKEDMSDELVERLESYDELMASYDEEYSNLMNDIYEDIDKIVYYTSGMMPTIENAPTDAKKELAKLNEDNLSPLGLPEVTKSTSSATVNNALKTYAKVFIKSGWFKAEVVDGTFTYVGLDADEIHYYGNWTGKFKVTNYSDEEDVATHETAITVKVTDNYYNFLQQKIDKKIAEDDENGEGSIYDVLSIKDLDKFKEAIKLYGLNRLKSFYDAIQGCIDLMIESDQANENAELYEDLYVPYLDKLQACQDEIDARQKTIDEYNLKLETSQKRQREIQKALDFRNYLGDDLYLEFCLFKREQKYINDNYISDGLENNEIFENAKAFLDAAKEELVKSGEHQHRIEGSLIDLLAIPEFEPLKEHFQVGNFIRIRSDDKVYRLRLISYQINFGEIQNLDVEFSDMTKIRSGTSDLQSVINQASSMASSYGAITNQVRTSKEQTDLMRNFVQNGLDATTMKIVNNSNNQNIVINDSGLLARRKDDFIDTYEDFQIKLLSNGLYFTDNAWRSVKSAFGKYYYTNPVTGKQEIKFGILADSIVGQLIIGEALRLYSNDASAEMSFDDKGLILNTKRDDNGQYKRILDIQKDGESILYIDNEGNLVFAQDQFVDMIEKLDRMNVKYLDADKLYANNGTILNFGANFAEIQDLSAPKGTITALTSDTIEAVSGHFTGNVKVDTKLLAAAAQLDALTSTAGNIGELESFKATLENLNATIATITTLNADEITAKKLNATAINFTELEAAKATIENLISEIANIKNLTSTKAIIENLSIKGDGTQADIDTLISALGVFTKITGDLGIFKELQADIANLTEAIIPTLSSTNATIENLNATLATIPTLNSTTITTDKIIAKSAKIEELDAALGDFEEIKAQLANIQTIMAGNIGTGLLQTIHLTAENTVLSEAFIKDLVAANISVSDLKAGAISTNKFQIQSDDGGIIINGTTQQFKDENGNVRVQIGKDAQGHFNFTVFDETGKGAIFDQNGITPAGIPSNTIVNDMVSDSANISGSKLDIDSVVTEINNNGTTTINSNKIWVDEDNQSLGASFTQMKQSVNGTIKSVTPYYAKSTSNELAPTDGWSEIPPSRIEGEYIWRKDLYTKTDSSTSWGEPYCVTGDRGENGSTGTGIESVTAEYAKSTSKTSAPTTGWSETAPEWEAGHYIWTRTKIVYNNPTSTKYTTPYCDSSWEAANAVDEKLTTLQTDFEVEQGKIESLIKETTIDNGDGTTTSLKDAYNQTKQTVEGNTTTIANVQAKVNDLTGDVESMDSRITTVETTADGLKTTVSKASSDASSALTSANQTASKFSWIVKSGSSATDFTLTDRTASLVADYINLNGKVTFSGLDSSAQNKINNAQSKLYEVNDGETTINGDGGSIRNLFIYGKSFQNGTPTPDNPIEIQSVVNPKLSVSNIDGTLTQEATIPYTLNAIPVSSGGNVMIDGQEYIADYVDIENKKLVRNVYNIDLLGTESWEFNTINDEGIANFYLKHNLSTLSKTLGICNRFKVQRSGIHNTTSEGFFINNNAIYIRILSSRASTTEAFKSWLSSNPINIVFQLATPTITDLSDEEVEAFKNLRTYEGVTNVICSSDQIGGKATFIYNLVSGFDSLYEQNHDQYLNKADQSVLDAWNSDTVESDITTINGGYIRTNSITTNQLDTNEIYGNSAFIGAIQATQLNADMITAGTIKSSLLNLYGFKMLNKTTNQESLSITDTGSITMRGSIESYNYHSGKTGWAINSTTDDAEFNNVTVRGSVITNDGGIVSAGGSGRNLQLNTSFYNGLTSWSRGDNYSVDTGFQYKLTNTVKFERSELTADSVQYLYSGWNKIPCTVGKSYTAQANFYTKDSSAIDGDGVVFGIYFYTSDHNSAGKFRKKVSVTNNQWTYESITAVAPENAAYVAIITGIYRNGTFWMAHPKLEEGNVATEWSLAPEDKTKQVRFWAGTTYEERESAPFIVYNDGYIKATQGNFSGVFSGTVDIGNIKITDPSSTAGGDALLTIQNGNNGIKKVQLKDTEYSSFAQNLIVSDNAYNTMIELGQNGYGTFKGGINVNNKIYLEGSHLTINGNELTTNSYGFLLNSPQVDVGTVNNTSVLNVYGQSNVNGELKVTKLINYNDTVVATIIAGSSGGIDWDFVV